MSTFNIVLDTRVKPNKMGQYNIAIRIIHTNDVKSVKYVNTKYIASLDLFNDIFVRNSDLYINRNVRYNCNKLLKKAEELYFFKGYDIKWDGKKFRNELFGEKPKILQIPIKRDKQTISSIFGQDYVESLKLTTDIAEDICKNLFEGLTKPESYESNRGDFVKIHSNVEYNRTFFDQKTCPIFNKNKSGKQGTFFHCTYSNIIANYWVDILLDELKLIVNDYIKLYETSKSQMTRQHIFKLKQIRNDKEIGYNDFELINTSITYTNPTSFCGKNNFSFIEFANTLCQHNVKRFANLIIFSKIKKSNDYDITPINIQNSNVFVDYVGYNGFKCMVEPLDYTPIMYINPIMIPFIEKLDDTINTKLKVNEYKSFDNEHRKSGLIVLTDDIPLNETNINHLYQDFILSIAV